MLPTRSVHHNPLLPGCYETYINVEFIFVCTCSVHLNFLDWVIKYLATSTNYGDYECVISSTLLLPLFQVQTFLEVCSQTSSLNVKKTRSLRVW